MAETKTYYAATKIKFGSRTDDGNKYESKTFEVGDKVVGLSVDDMKGLWSAGALTTQAPEVDDSKEEKDTEEPTPDKPGTPTTSGTKTPAKPATPTKP